MKIIGIIQARMGSTRLPGKMLLSLGGKLVIEHVFGRARAAKKISQVVLATTTSPADDPLAAWATEQGIPYFRGSESDVLDRYYECAKLFEADAVVRLTGDCPLLDPQVIDGVVDAYVSVDGKYEYVSNIHPPTFPDGLDTEVFSFGALEKAWREAALQSEREHVTPYIWKNPEIFPASNVSCTVDGKSINLSEERWTLDTPSDFNFLRAVVEHLESGEDKSDFSSIFNLINTNPDWRDINAGQTRNEGYAKSLQEDDE
ncbi:MAG: glycosyltransferase family protein [Candidatus Magasanikbacteria bacterium]|nr:glycosyltransferase family protein [Candidatus Magasanikbacteria bacterium]